MAKKQNNSAPTEVEQAYVEAMDKTQDFFERNNKIIIGVLVAIVVIVAAYFGYTKLIKEPREQKALTAMYEAQYTFESEEANYELALNGESKNGGPAGFLDVVEQYGSTPAGNLATHYAGVCYLKLGDFNNAEKYLSKYKATKGAPNAIINALNLGLQGDVKVQLQEYDRAVNLYKKAVDEADNNLTTPMMLKKLGLVYIKQGKQAEAKSVFERIILEYPQSVEARDAAKYISK